MTLRCKKVNVLKSGHVTIQTSVELATMTDTIDNVQLIVGH